MVDPAQRDRIRRVGSRLGVAMSALTVFIAGWIAVKNDDWRKVTIVAILAGVAGVIVSGLAARSR
jgi:hypothetical protein